GNPALLSVWTVRCNYLKFLSLYLFFFFQAEDGIRDRNVTGVQTCALPISSLMAVGMLSKQVGQTIRDCMPTAIKEGRTVPMHDQIGRASCRERVEMSGGAVSTKKKNRNRRNRHDVA